MKAVQAARTSGRYFMNTLQPLKPHVYIAFQDRLLIFGGTWCHCYNCKCNRPTKNIYEYDDSEESGEFKCIGSTPEAQYLCLACTIDNTIFIAGGAVTDTEALKNVYILTCM